MAESNSEPIYIGVCKCCLSDGSYHDIWAEYFYNGEREIYGDMLAECFGSLWQDSKNEVIGVEQICVPCVKRLRDAYHFKNLIVASQKTMEYLFQKDSDVASLRDSAGGDHDDCGGNVQGDGDDGGEDDDGSGDFTEGVKVEVKMENEDDEYGLVYEDVEYLEEDVRDAGQVTIKSEDFEFDPSYDYELAVSRNRGRRRKTGVKKRKRPYLNYSMEEVAKSMELVRSKTLSVMEAATMFNIPLSSLKRWIQTGKKPPIGEDSDTKRHTNEKQLKFEREVKQLLSFTNAIIYKTRATRLYCAYCRSPSFADGAELRAHTLSAHAERIVSHAELALRPHWFYEIVKLDISNLRCTACDLPVARWPDLLHHLTTEHSLTFKELLTKLIPYVLDSENQCALCERQFKNYHLLDGHMNSHYKNHVCNKCGDTFLTVGRLKKHVEIHTHGEHPCDLCGKMFALEKYMKKHKRYVHSDEPRVTCLYCGEKFRGTYPRHLHVLECHPGKVKTKTCEFCGQVFDWSPYYFAHMRRQHPTLKKFKCTKCNVVFDTLGELKKHSHDKIMF